MGITRCNAISEAPRVIIRLIIQLSEFWFGQKLVVLSGVNFGIRRVCGSIHTPAQSFTTALLDSPRISFVL